MRHIPLEVIMPEPASSRSLEDILASIRKSLADESVDGLVQLSSAAVDAARAEHAQPVSLRRAVADAARLASTGMSPSLSPADVLADDLLRDKLAGALVLDGEETVAEDLSALIEPATPAQSGSGSASDDPSLSKIWYLRPGRRDSDTSANGEDAGQASSAEDASSDAPDLGATISSMFSLSPRDLIGESPAREETPPERAPTPPRLDSESSALLDKLKASNAAAIGNIARLNAESADSTGSNGETEAPLSAAASEPHSDSDQGNQEPSVQVVPPHAELLQNATAAATQSGLGEPLAEKPLLSFPERSTPLFGAKPDQRRPIVTSGAEHLLPDEDAKLLVPDVSEPEASAKPEATPAVAAPEQPNAVAEISDLVVESGPASEVAARPAAEAAPLTVSASPASNPMEETQAVPARDQSPAPPSSSSGGNKALEDMIAAVLEPVLQKLIETRIAPKLEDMVRLEVERLLKQPPEARKQ